MKPSSYFAFLLVPVMVFMTAEGAVAGPGGLPRSAPEEQGMDSGALFEWVEALDGIDSMNSVMLVRHGKVVAEGWWAPYGPESRHELYSLSKSFASTAVGMAVAEGRLGLFDEVLKFFPDAAPDEPSANLKAMRVRDLLTMSTGHQDEPSAAADTVCPKTFFSQPVPHKPGSHFKYNTAATFMLSAIVQRRTGQTLLDYLHPRLFEPLGIEAPTWDTNFEGVSLGGYGLKVRTEDIAKFGQLYLQMGRWEGRVLIPEEWVALATGRQMSNGSNPASDWDQGYGFQFWQCRHGAYRGDGAFGQYCVVLPGQDAVLAITSGVRNMQQVLDVVWDKLLPAFRPVPLPANPGACEGLRSKLAGLSVRHPQGLASSPLAAQVVGKRYVFQPNDQKLESLMIAADAGGGTLLVMRRDGVESRFPLGYREWRQGRGSLAHYLEVPAAGSAAWTAEDTWVGKICLYETPFYTTATLRFEGDEVRLDAEGNVGFGSTRQPQLVGRRESIER